MEYIVTYQFDEENNLWKTTRFTNKEKAENYYNRMLNHWHWDKIYFSIIDNDNKSKQLNKDITTCVEYNIKETLRQIKQLQNEIESMNIEIEHFEKFEDKYVDLLKRKLKTMIEIKKLYKTCEKHYKTMKLINKATMLDEEGLLMNGFCTESKDDTIYKMSQELKEYYSK